jgi:hypothetical protein
MARGPENNPRPRNAGHGTHTRWRTSDARWFGMRSISTTAAAHAAMSRGTPAASASPATSSAGPIANKSNAEPHHL